MQTTLTPFVDTESVSLSDLERKLAEKMLKVEAKTASAILRGGAKHGSVSTQIIASRGPQCAERMLVSQLLAKLGSNKQELFFRYGPMIPHFGSFEDIARNFSVASTTEEGVKILSYMWREAVKVVERVNPSIYLERTSEFYDKIAPLAAREREERGDRESIAISELVNVHVRYKDPLVCSIIADHYDLWLRGLAAQRVRTLPSEAIVSLDDLHQSAREAFLGALDRYDPHSGLKLSTWAVSRVRGAFADELRRCDVLGRDTRKKVRRTDELRDKYIELHHKEPSIPELADFMGISDAELEDTLAIKLSARTLSLDLPIYDKDSSFTLRDTVADYSSDNLLELLVKHQRDESLGEAVDSLPDRHRDVLKLYYGNELKLNEIGEMLGVTESRICQIKKEGINITYPIKNSSETLTVWTSRPDTNFGATFIVISPENPLFGNIITPEYKKEVEKYLTFKGS